MLSLPKPGEVTACCSFTRPSVSEGWISAMGLIRSHLCLVSPLFSGSFAGLFPVFFRSWPLCSGSVKLLRGCLTYSRPLYVSREYLYILWPECAIGTGLEIAASFGLRASSQNSGFVGPAPLFMFMPRPESAAGKGGESRPPVLGFDKRPEAAAWPQKCRARARRCLRRDGAV
jgi:hypothetical protein